MGTTNLKERLEMPIRGDPACLRVRSPLPALRSLEVLLIGEGPARLREGFLMMASDSQDGGMLALDVERDVIEGYVFEDWQVSAVSLHYADFLKGKLLRAASRVLADIETSFVESDSKAVARLLRLYEARANELRASLDSLEDRTLTVAGTEILRQTIEDARGRAKSLAQARQDKSSSRGGRPLDKTADQVAIQKLVIEYASLPRYQHSDGTPKPTAIRDRILNHHTEAYGELGARALFDRVRAALAELSEAT